MRFSKELFKRNATSIVKRSLPESHLNILDGRIVEFNEHDDYGEISYTVEGEERGFMLYPVAKEWCSE